MDYMQGASRRQRWLAKLKFLFVAGGGLFGDGYLNTTIGLVVPMLGYLYWKHNHDNVPALQGDEIKGSFNIGMIVGQIAFGCLGDTLGRHRVYGKELLFTIFGTLLVILLPWHGLSHNGIVAWISVFRVVTGMGTGGDYPMTSSLSTENGFTSSRAKLVLLVFSFNTIGAFSAGIMFLILLAGFKHDIMANIDKLEWVWRLLLGIGIIPAIFTLNARLRMKETKPYEMYVASRTAESDESKRSLATQWRDFREYFSEWRHARVLFATCASWFLYDIATYGIGLNQSIVLAAIGFAGGKTPWEKLWKTAIGNLIVQCAGAIPGVYIGVFLPDLIGRQNTQLFTCLIASIFFAIWAGVSNIASSGGQIALFTLAQLALSAGPNVTTFLNPVELFPTRVRGTAHGLSAASGKAGALLTAFAFGILVDSIGLRGVLGMLSGFLFLIVPITLLIPETKGASLQDIEQDTIYGKKTSSHQPPAPASEASSERDMSSVAKVQASVKTIEG